MMLDMIDLYELYINEVEGSQIVKTDKGFAIFKYLDDVNCYITEIFVHPDHRTSGEARKLGDKVAKIAKESGKKVLIGSVGVGINNAERSIRMLLDYGMKLHSSNDKVIYFSKEL